MKNLILTCFIVITITTNLIGQQKFAYVDSDYILNNIPEYKTAQQELDNLSAQWQKEIENKIAEVDKLYKSYQAEQLLLPDDMKKKRENEIILKEKEIKELQKKRFGTDGDLFKKRQELVKPIQDKIYKAIEDLANKNNYSIILDKAGQITFLYADPKLDKSDDVLQNMGYKGGKKEKSLK